jgi:hypothetical protein
MNMMLVFKNTIANSEFSKHDKKLLWAVATVAFAEPWQACPNLHFLPRVLTVSSGS